MRVQLISSTPDPLWIITKAARECYDSHSTTISSDHKLFLAMLRRDETPLEHATFTFRITDVSRTLTHQLVRHRIASFNQQSQRYVEADGHHYTPNLDYMDPQYKQYAVAKYDSAMQFAFDRYFELIDLGVKREDARYVLPNATFSSLIMTMNLRSLRRLFLLRLSSKAQAEIRDLAMLILTITCGKFPIELTTDITTILSTLGHD